MPRNRGQTGKENKRDEIIVAARGLFVGDGFDHSPMSRVARDAGVTTNTLYWYFRDKDDLLVAVLGSIAADDAADYREVAGKPLTDRLLWLVDRLRRLGPLVATVHARAADSPVIDEWHNGFHAWAESLFAADVAESGTAGPQAAAMVQIGAFVIEGLLTHSPGPDDTRAVIDQLVRTIPTNVSARAVPPSPTAD